MYICIFPVSMLASFMKPSLVFTLTDIGYFSVEFSRILHFNVDGYSFEGNVTLKVKVNFKVLKVM